MPLTKMLENHSSYNESCFNSGSSKKLPPPKDIKS